jgi:hypothetical protein
VTSVHPCSGTPCTLGTSPETAAVIATQKTMVPAWPARRLRLPSPVPTSPTRPCPARPAPRGTLSGCR